MKHKFVIVSALLVFSSFFVSCSQSTIVSINPNLKKVGDSNVDLVYFYDDHCSKTTQHVRQARADLKGELGQYIEQNLAQDSLASQIGVNAAPTVVVLKNEVEAMRFSPTSKDQVVSNVRSVFYR